MRRLVITFCCFVILTSEQASAGAPQKSEATRPNVLLLVADDMRPDVLSAFGHPHVKTPFLDGLVRSGTVFRQATCANPVCVPSRAELLSGRTSFKNGFYPHRSLKRDALPLLAEVLRGGGYRTFYVGKWHTTGRPSTSGYQQAVGLFAGGGKAPKQQVDHAGRPVTGYGGWVFQTDAGQKFPERGVGLTPGISADFADAAIEVIRGKHAAPFFLHVNFTAPHDPRLIPPGFEKKHAAKDMQLPKNFRSEHPFDHGNLKGRDEKLLAFPRTKDEVRAELAAYYAVIEHLDQQIGRILAALESAGLAENTIVIFTSDHGLAIGSHGLVGKQNMYAHTINVPLIFRGPGVPKGQSRTAGCYLRDLYPTVCEVAGIAAPEGLDGRSLVPVLRGKRDSIHPFIVGYFTNTQRMIRKGSWTYIIYPEAGREQLFNLEADPDELYNLATDPVQAPRKQELRRELRRWLAEQGDGTAGKLAVK